MSPLKSRIPVSLRVQEEEFPMFDAETTAILRAVLACTGEANAIANRHYEGSSSCY